MACCGARSLAAHLPPGVRPMAQRCEVALDARGAWPLASREGANLADILRLSGFSPSTPPFSSGYGQAPTRSPTVDVAVLAARCGTRVYLNPKAMPPYEPENMAAMPKPKLGKPEKAAQRNYEIVYFNVLLFLFLHLSAVYGLWLGFTSAKWRTIGFAIVWYVMGELGIICGAHRLWCHRSFKAKLPLEIMLMLFNCIGFQNTATDWVRDHRLHHRYVDTDADPHNASRGMFFSHIGWLLVKKHPEVKQRGKEIDISDVTNNPVLRFQKKYAFPLITTLCFVLPTIIPVLCWDETLITAWHLCILRYVLNLNGTWLVNSAAHKYGTRPYDKNVAPTQNLLCTFTTLGEGFHNYHHTFPWDYRSAELGNNLLNFTTWFIDFFALIGWAYDRKTASEHNIKTRMNRTGDGNGTRSFW